MFNFNKEDDLEISYAGSKIRLCKSGDIIINAKRHTIHHRQLLFDGCDQEFIDKAVRAHARGKEELERYVMGRNRASEFTSCDIKKERRIKK
jgi:hypothetical protein